jgi:hypothetical protein
MYINKIGGEIKFTAEKVLTDWLASILYVALIMPQERNACKLQQLPPCQPSG